MLSTAFIPAAGLAPATRAYSPTRVTTAPRAAPARTAAAAPRWRLMTSSSPDPGTQKPSASTSSVEPASSSSNATGTSGGAPEIDYAIDGEELLERAKLMAVDVSERPFYYSKIAGYAVGALVVLTVLRAVVSAIDSLPVLPAALELIGLGYAAWFVWRYVLFRESRAELLEEIDDFLGRTRPRSD